MSRGNNTVKQNLKLWLKKKVIYTTDFSLCFAKIGSMARQNFAIQIIIK